MPNRRFGRPQDRCHVMPDKLEQGIVEQMYNIALVADKETAHAQDLMACLQQLLA
jgi:hypothetical protein